MRFAILPAALVMLGAVGAAAPALADDDVTVRTDSAALPVQGARLLTLEVPVGEVTVTAGDVDRVEARLEVRCDRGSRRCREKAADIRLRSQRSGDDLSMEVIGFPRHNGGKSLHADVEITVPRALAVRIEMGVGELEVRGVEGDVDVELGVGEVRVLVPESAVAEVTVDVGVGEANLRPRPKGTRSSRFLFLGNEIDWDGGSGRSSISVELGVGEADVELVP